MNKTQEQIGILIGEASMCWSETPSGIFQSQRANEIVTELMNLVHQARPNIFRVWIISQNCYMIGNQMENLPSNIGVFTPYNTITLSFREDDLIFEQYLGERDKNNRPIFDGDIVENGYVVGNSNQGRH